MKPLKIFDGSDREIVLVLSVFILVMGIGFFGTVIAAVSCGAINTHIQTNIQISTSENCMNNYFKFYISDWQLTLITLFIIIELMFILYDNGVKPKEMGRTSYALLRKLMLLPTAILIVLAGKLLVMLAKKLAVIIKAIVVFFTANWILITETALIIILGVVAIFIWGWLNGLKYPLEPAAKEMDNIKIKKKNGGR